MNSDTGVTLLDFTGTYAQQDFWRRSGGQRLDLTALSGTRGYCDEEAYAALRRALAGYSAYGLHWLDSGNYHYATLLWLEKIAIPFDLLVLDHHTDRQPPAFEGMLSCGSWILEAEKLPKLGRVYLLGPPENQIRLLPPSVQEYCLAEEELSPDRLKRWLKKSDRPLYVSFDKDLLSPETAPTDWDQGTLSLEEAAALLQAAGTCRSFLGADFCGEWAGGPPCGQNQINDRLNGELLRLLAALRKRPSGVFSEPL